MKTQGLAYGARRSGRSSRYLFLLIHSTIICLSEPPPTPKSRWPLDGFYHLYKSLPAQTWRNEATREAVDLRHPARTGREGCNEKDEWRKERERKKGSLHRSFQHLKTLGF